MDGLLSLLIFAALFYVMMRFGCGAHMTHGHGGHGGHADRQKDIDPVCGMEIDQDKGYGVMHEGKLYRVCSRRCLDTFEQDPSRYMNGAAQHEHGGH